MATPRDCAKCGTRIERPIANQQYCPKCRPVFWRPSPPRPCATCGEEFQPDFARRRYCSDECKPPPPTRKPRIDPSRVCSCGEKWVPNNKRVQTQLCPNCRDERDLLHVYSQAKGWKRAVRKRADNRCEECKRTEAEAGAPLHAHHIAPRSVGGQNTLINGRLLCHSCHTAAHGSEFGVQPFYDPKPLSPSKPTPDLVDQIAQRVSELLSNDLDGIKTRIAAIEELAQRY